MDQLVQELPVLIASAIMYTLSFIAIMELFLRKAKMTNKRLGVMSLVILVEVFVANILMGQTGFENALTVSLIVLMFYFSGTFLTKASLYALTTAVQLGMEEAVYRVAVIIDEQMKLNYFLDQTIVLYLLTMCMLLLSKIIKIMIRYDQEEYMYFNISTRQSIATIIFSIGSIGSTVTMVSMIRRYNVVVTSSLKNTILSLLYTSGPALALIAINESILKEYYQKVNLIMREQMKKQLAYYKRLEEVNKETRAIKHDMHNHLLAMEGLLEDNKQNDLKLYISNIRDTIKNTKKIFHTGNSIVDAIINEKYVIALEHHISMIIQLSIPHTISINVVDLCTIVANSIDNAIEACLKVEECEKRRIEIIGQYRGGYLLYQITNSIKDESVKIKDNQVKTIKKDKLNHGFGLENIRKSIEQYDGEFNISSRNYEFLLDVSINCSCM